MPLNERLTILLSNYLFIYKGVGGVKEMDFRDGKDGKVGDFSYGVTVVTNVQSCYKLLRCSCCY